MPDFSPAIWAMIGVLVAIQLALMITALVIAIRTPAERLTLPRAVWILLCFVQFIGPIAFLAAGRKPAEAIERERAQSSDSRVEATINELYR